MPPSETRCAVPSLTLRRIVARPVVVPLRRPIVARIATLSEWPVVLVDVETDEGVVGRSYLEPYVPRAMKYLVDALHDLGEGLAGRRVAPAELHALARKSLQFVGYGGLAMIAVSAVDMAAWDALARAAGVPLCVLLGGSVGAVRAYNSNGLWLQPAHVVAAEAVALRDEGGFSALKLRLGRARPSDDLATLRAVREAVGGDVELMVDFNQGLTRAEALERCHALDGEGLAWIEEPLVYEDLDGHAQLAAQLATPIQIGENFYGPRDLQEALQRRACDFVMPDFMRIGGVTGWMRAAAIAGTANVPMSSHLYPEVAAHVLRVTETAHWLEWQDWIDPLLQRPYAVRDGALHVPDVPGLGLEWNEDAVATYRA
ncbi:MAG TPA: enolase C-terminal domain-like protein [Casimicrobiaceae bacterium]|nr:enolase C-terminal domain-like protein [Casimicrobiaceae bacterium]